MPGSYDKVEVCVTRESLVVQHSLFFLTSGLADHDVAVFAFSPIVKALHFDIIGGLRLEMSNHVPVFYT